MMIMASGPVLLELAPQSEHWHVVSIQSDHLAAMTQEALLSINSHDERSGHPFQDETRHRKGKHKKIKTRQNGSEETGQISTKANNRKLPV